MSIDLDLHADTCILRLKGRFITGSIADYLLARDMLGQVTYRNLLLDCRAVPYLDSTGIGFVVGLMKAVIERGGRFELLRPSRRVREVLKICHLEGVIPITEADPTSRQTDVH